MWSGQIPSEPCTPEGYPYFRPNNATGGQLSKINVKAFFPECRVQEK
jgi:hypothetical protein